jgi:hypothetical protein
VMNLIGEVSCCWQNDKALIEQKTSGTARLSTMSAFISRDMSAGFLMVVVELPNGKRR